MSNMPFDEWVKMVCKSPTEGVEPALTLPTRAVVFIYEENERAWKEVMDLRAQLAAGSERVNALELQAKQDVTQLAAMCNEVVRLREALEEIAAYEHYDDSPIGHAGRIAALALSRQDSPNE